MVSPIRYVVFNMMVQNISSVKLICTLLCRTFLISTHHLRYTMVVSSQSLTLYHLKGFQTAAFDIIQRLCGPYWALIQEHKIFRETLEKYLLHLGTIGPTMPCLNLRVVNSSRQCFFIYKNLCKKNISDLQMHGKWIQMRNVMNVKPNIQPAGSFPFPILSRCGNCTKCTFVNSL